MPLPAVSVLMTAFNREKYIAEAIESVLASTFQDFELIIVDDGSKDGTLEIARRYTSDPRVQVHINEKNMGDYPNRNRAAELARGKYLKYVDSDDYIYPHGLEVMVRSMERFPTAGLGICLAGSSDGPYPVQLQPEQTYREHFFGGNLFSQGPSGCIIRAEAFHLLNGFSGKRYIGDTEMWLRLGARYPVVKMVSDLVWWRTHPDQEYNLERTNPEFYSLMRFQAASESLKSPYCPLSGTERESSICRVKYSFARAIWRCAIYERRFRSAIHLFRDSGLSFWELSKGLFPSPIDNAHDGEGLSRG